jgi:thiamine biosynthesis lipoprotein
MRIDLGGIAKGWIAEHAARIVAVYAAACAVNAGGDMFSIGLAAGEKNWRVALEDPRDPAATLGILQVGPGAVATSSTMRRRWEQGGQVRHHLIDPRTGAPAESDWLSVTVIAGHAAIAEVVAKVLLIAGSREAEKFAARRRDIAFIAVDAAGRLWGSSNAKEFLDVGIEYA